MYESNTMDVPGGGLDGCLPNPSVGVFICSSDSRRDVLTRILPSVGRFWPDCPYPIYVGTNSTTTLPPGMVAVTAELSSWRQETLAQIKQLHETHLILLLDDYLFRAPVLQSAVARYVDLALTRDLVYLRLLPLRRSIFERLFVRIDRNSPLYKIRERRPYYSGLQIAIWNKEHLAQLLGGEGSIWEFEHHRKDGAHHFAITGSAPIRYAHLVEKGRWLPYAARFLQEAGFSPELGTRRIWPKWMNLRLVLDEIKFHLLGYANH